MPKIIRLESCNKANNFSAAFWDDVNATPDNFYKSLKDSDYKIIAMYATKVINEHQVGISTSLKTKIVHFLKYLFTDTYISDLFSKEEEKLAQKVLKDLCSTVFPIPVSDIEMSDVLKVESRLMKIKRHFKYSEDDIILAKQYLGIIAKKRKTEESFFSSDEKIQANIVMLKVLTLAKEERKREIEFLEAKLKSILDI